MPKRKRESGLEESLATWEKELVRGLKTAKGFERQRLSKRIREADPTKAERLEREVGVLKSLDLHQAAHAHLCSSLLKIKGIAESPKLPEQLKPISKPNLSEEERIALHNVTSALCNRKQVKDIIDKAIVGTCMALKVSMPDKKAKGKGKKSDKDDGEDKPDYKEETSKKAAKTKTEKTKAQPEPESVEESEDEPDLDEGVDQVDEDMDSDEEEKAFSRYDDLIGGSSDDDDDAGGNDSDWEDLRNSRAGAIQKVDLDDISISSGEDEEDGDDEDEENESDDEEEEEFEGFDDPVVADGTGDKGKKVKEDDNDDDDDDEEEEEEESSVSPPPQKLRTKPPKPAPGVTGQSTFLPSLMGGYISGSESASDVDVAPPAKKNRRGQRARQAIWEKKYGEKAKHKQNEKPGRDQGWDMRRGAVGTDGDDGRPWKKGIKNPFEKNNNFATQQRSRPPAEPTRTGANNMPVKPRQEPKRDDTGPLHPSWAAAKKAKDEKVEFAGTKIVFD